MGIVLWTSQVFRVPQWDTCHKIIFWGVTVWSMASWRQTFFIMIMSWLPYILGFLMNDYKVHGQSEWLRYKFLCKNVRKILGGNGPLSFHTKTSFDLTHTHTHTHTHTYTHTPLPTVNWGTDEIRAGSSRPSLVPSPFLRGGENTLFVHVPLPQES